MNNTIQQSSIKLCRATKNDIDMMIDMRILFGEELGGKPEPSVEKEIRSNLREYFIDELNKTCLCGYAAVNGQAVSVAAMVLRRQPAGLKSPTGRWGYLMNVYTLPEFRRSGLSSLVINELIHWSATLGITAFELHATQAGAPVYEKLGFSVHPEPTYRKFV